MTYSYPMTLPGYAHPIPFARNLPGYGAPGPDARNLPSSKLDRLVELWIYFHMTIAFTREDTV